MRLERPGQLLAEARNLRLSVQSGAAILFFCRFGIQSDVVFAAVLESFGRIGVGTQKLPVPAALVKDYEGGVHVRNPLQKHVVGRRNALLDVIGDEVAVGTPEVIAAGLVGPKVLSKHLELETEAQQVVLAAHLEVPVRRPLRVVKNALSLLAPDPGAFEPLGDLRRRKAHQRGFVDVVDQLAIEPAFGNREACKRALLPQWVGDTGHKILGGFQREEGGRLALVESCVLGHQGPKALDHASSEPTNRENVDPAADVLRGHLAVGLRQGALGEEDENFSGGNASIKECLEVASGLDCFAGAYRPFDEEPISCTGN